MRCCWSSAARVLTLLSLAFLSSHSLLLVNAQTTDAVDIPKPEDARSPTATSAVPTITSHSASPTNTSIPPEVTPAPPTTSSTSSSTPPSTSSTPSSSTSSPVQSTSPTQTPSPSPSSTTPSPLAFVSVTSSTSSSSTGSSSSSSSPLASSTSSSSLIPTISSSSPGVTLLGQSGTTLVATATNALVTDDSATSYTWSVSASSTATGAAAIGSSKSFFDNKGAVAGTFSAAGVVIIGAIVIAIVFSRRRAARLQDEEDLTYFEKYEGPTSTNASAANDGSHTPTEPEMSYMGHGGAHGMDVNDEPLATYAAPDAYPDRTMHFGLPSMEEYAQPRAMGLDFGSAVDYPPEMSYNATQYAGYEGYNPTQYAGYDGGYAQTQQPYYASSYPAQTMPAHPYANPTNSPRMAGAPAVQLYGEAT